MRAPTRHEERDSRGSTTARLVFALLAGNVCATVAVAAFRPFPGQGGFLEDGGHLNMVLTAGTLSLVSSGLLFMLSALRRGHRAWWTVVTAVNVVQIGRLGPALAAISLWPQDRMAGRGRLWGFVAVPVFGVLASLGIIVTVRESGGRSAAARRAAARRGCHDPRAAVVCVPARRSARPCPPASPRTWCGSGLPLGSWT